MLLVLRRGFWNQFGLLEKTSVLLQKIESNQKGIKLKVPFFFFTKKKQKKNNKTGKKDIQFYCCKYLILQQERKRKVCPFWHLRRP